MVNIRTEWYIGTDSNQHVKLHRTSSGPIRDHSLIESDDYLCNCLKSITLYHTLRNYILYCCETKFNICIIRML